MADVQDQAKESKGQLSYDNAPPPAQPPADSGRKRRIRFVLLAVLVVAAIVSIPVYFYYAARETTDDAQVDGHVVPISARVNGTILEVLVRDNEQVRAGQPLLRLDPADFQVSAAQAEAQLANAQATTSESGVNIPLTNINTESQIDTSKTQIDESQAAVNSAQQSVNEARARIALANANVAARQADSDKAQKDLARLTDLVNKDEISKQDYDSAVASSRASEAAVQAEHANVTAAQHALEKAQADVLQAKAKLQTSQVLARQSAAVKPRQVEVSEARLRQAQAAVKQSEANLRQANLNLDYTTIKAPIDGVVSKKTAEPGLRLNVGQQVMALVPLDDVWVTANFKETQLRKMRIGQKVEIEVDTFGGGRKYNGHIESIAAASGSRFSFLPPENATGNYVKVVQRVPVKILLEPGENKDHRLLPGMSVSPVVLLGSGN